MKVDRFIAAVLVGCWAVTGLRAQQVVDTPVTPNSGPAERRAFDVPGVSNWVRNQHDGCCHGPTGGDGGIGTELYFRTGPAIPLGSGEVLSRNLQTGFTVQGGARTLFFDPEYRRAWVVDTGLVNTFNSGGGTRPAETFNLSVLVPNPAGGDPTSVRRNVDVGIRNFNKTFVSLGLGREWYLGGSARDACSHWRVGVDGGGRYGSASIELDRILPHRTDVVGGAYFGTWINREFEWFGTIVQAGVRGEWAYTWSDILQRATDGQDIHILLNLGIRY